jgi:hypothetical protein
MTEFRLEFFRTTVVPSGQELLGAHTAWTDTNGDLAFKREFAADAAAWDFVSATATSLEDLSTSELSDVIFALPADSVAPTTSIVLLGDEGTEGWFRSAVTVALEAVDDPDGSGVAEIEYSLDGSAFGTYSGAFEISSPGMSRVRARATDRADNVEDPPATTAVKVDTSAPEISVSSPEARSYLHSEILQLGIGARDDGSGLTPGDPLPELDGVAVSDGQTIELLSLPLGSHTLTVRAGDLAGNASAQSVRFEVIASIGSLTDAVQLMVSRGLIEGSNVERGLLSKLEQADGALARGKTRVATNKLHDFVDQVRSQDGKHMAPEAAALLLSDAEYVLATLP